MKTIKLTERDLTKLVKKILREQTLPAKTPAVNTTTTPAKPKSPEQNIADKIIKATQGAATNESNLLIAIQSIPDSKSFWNINSYLKQNGNKLDFIGILNDEVTGPDDKDLRDSIYSHLKKLGITLQDIPDKANPNWVKIGYPPKVPAETYKGSTETTDARLTNIYKVISTLDAQGNVTNSKGFVGKPYQEWAAFYKVTKNEEDMAKKYFGSQKPNTPAAPAAPANTQKPKPAAARRKAVPQGVPSATDLEAFLK